MIRWLLATFPSWVLTLLVVGGLMLFAATGLLFVRRRWPHMIAGEHNDVAGILLGVVGATYGILLAFIIVAVYQDFSDAGASVRAEASALAEIVADTRGMPIEAPMAATVGEYVHAVVEQEWPLMASGGSSTEAQADVEGMFALLQRADQQGGGQGAFFDAAVNDVNNLIDARRDRLFDAAEELPVVLQVLLIGGAILLVAFTWLFGMKLLRAQLLMVMGVAALIGFSVLIALMIDHPFTGDLSVSSSPFREGALAVFWSR